MMYSEFYDRTKKEVSAEEYHYIEESYYEFDGNKDQFCKAWLKDLKSGHWATEYRLRKAMDDQKKAYEEQLNKQKEDLEFYGKWVDELRQKVKAAKSAKIHLEAVLKDLQYNF